MRGLLNWGKTMRLTLLLSLFTWNIAVPAEVTADGGGAYQVESLAPSQSWFFDPLLDVATDKDGNVYAAMTSGGDGYIAVYDSQGRQLAKWDEFEEYSLYPTSLTVDQAGDVYVYSRPYVLKLDIIDLEIVGISQIGNFEETNGYVRSLAVDDQKGVVYAADAERESIWILKENGLEEWTSYSLPDEGVESFGELSAIEVDADGGLLAATGDGLLVKLNQEGQLLQRWDASSWEWPSTAPALEHIGDVTAGRDGSIYLINDESAHIYQLNHTWTEVVASTSLTANGRLVSFDSLAFAPEGRIYVVDSYGPQLIIVDDELTRLTSWGSMGTGDGQFMEPANLALLSDGTLLVSDWGNGRIQRLGNDLQYLEQFTGEGFEPGAIVASPSGDIFFQSGNYLLKYKLGGTEEPVVLADNFGGVVDLAMDSLGRLYAANNMNYRIDRFTSDGVREESFIEEMSWRPTSAAIDSARERVYVSNGLSVAIYNLEGELVASQFGGLEGMPSSGLDDIALDSAGNVYVVYSGGSLIYKLNPEGNLLDVWGSYGTGNDQFQYAHKAVVDHVGNVFVVDRNSNRVQKFSFSGNQLQDLTLSEGALDREFVPTQAQYTAEVDYEVAELTLQPEAAEQHATISVNGTAVVSGEASHSIALAAGEETIIDIVVTANDGQARTYRLTVKRANAGAGGEEPGGEEPGGEQPGGEEPGGEEPGGQQPGGSTGSGSNTPQPPALMDESAGGEAGRLFIRGIQAEERAGGLVQLTVSEQGIQALLAMSSVPQNIQAAVTSITAQGLVLKLPASIARLIDRQPEAVLEIRMPVGQLRLPLKELTEQAGLNAQGLLVTWETAQHPTSTGTPAWQLGLYSLGINDSRQPIAYDKLRMEISVKLPDVYTQDTIAALSGIGYSEEGNRSHAPALFKLNGAQAEAIFKLRRGGIYTIWSEKAIFEDLTRASYAAQAIQALGNKQILQGLGLGAANAEPLAEVSRAQFVALLARGLDVGVGQRLDVVFTDVLPGTWYYEPILTANERGWMQGYEDGSFKPEGTLNRQEMAVLLYRALRSEGLTESLPAAEVSRLLASYQDAHSIAPWAREAVAYMSKLGLMRGTGNGSFAPGSLANRAQSAVVIYKMLKQLQLAD